MNLSSLAGRTAPLPKTVGRPWGYFAQRGILLDCRGPLVIDPTSRWGLRVSVVTASHGVHDGPGTMGPTIPYGVTVKANAWIGSFSMLAGCEIGEGAIVAVGSVVRGQIVAPGVMVAGNPARVIARWSGSAWHYLPLAESGYQTRLA